MDKSGFRSEANAPPVEGGWTPQAPPSYNQSQNVYPSGPMTQPVDHGQPMQPMLMHSPQTVHMGPGPIMYNQQQGQPLVVQVPGNQIRVGPHPCPVTCPSCQAFVTTRVEYATTGRTHLIALLMCLFGCGLCSCIPYCVDSLKCANHYCPKCEAYIGLYEPTSHF